MENNLQPIQMRTITEISLYNKKKTKRKERKRNVRFIINFCTIICFRLCGTINGVNTRQVNHVVEWSRVACSQAYRFEFLPWTRANLRYICNCTSAASSAFMRQMSHADWTAISPYLLITRYPSEFSGKISNLLDSGEELVN